MNADEKELVKKTLVDLLNDPTTDLLEISFDRSVATRIDENYKAVVVPTDVFHLTVIIPSKPKETPQDPPFPFEPAVDVMK